LYHQAHFLVDLKELIGAVRKFFMDICLINIDNRLNKTLKTLTIHGMLWLQTHFDESQWEAISDDLVVLSEKDSELLIKDARSAGISIQSLSNKSILDVLPKTN